MNAMMMPRMFLWRRRWSQASAIVGGGKPRRLPERRGECVRTAEAYHQADFRYRDRAFRQQQLGMLHATVGLVPMWGHSERLFEYPREMTRAQPNEACQGGKWYPLVDVFLDMVGDDLLLPGCEATPDWRLNAG